MKRKYEGSPRERRRQAVADYRARDPERSRAQVRKYINNKLEKRAGEPRPDKCEVCGEGGRICLDHCHKTGVFRGWLCNRCNLFLGKVKDDPLWLLNLACYLIERKNGKRRDA